MGRSNITVATAAAAFTLIIIFQLIASWGLPQVEFWHWRHDAGSWSPTSLQRPLGVEVPYEGQSYLLGVGKADITGYDDFIVNARRILKFLSPVL